jgi:hypothetical protein
MNIILADDYRELSELGSGIVSTQIMLKPDCVLGLARVILLWECIKN